MSNTNSNKVCPRLSYNDYFMFHPNTLLEYSEIVRAKDFDFDNFDNYVCDLAATGLRSVRFAIRYKTARSFLSEQRNLCKTVVTYEGAGVGLQFEFKKFETPEPARDTSKSICYTSKKSMPSNTIGNIDRRQFRQRVNFEQSHVKGEKLPSNPLPPTIPAKPKAWCSKAEAKLNKEIPQTLDDFIEEPKGFWTEQQVKPYDYRDCFDDDEEVQEVKATPLVKAQICDFLKTQSGEDDAEVIVVSPSMSAERFVETVSRVNSSITLLNEMVSERQEKIEVLEAEIREKDKIISDIAKSATIDRVAFSSFALETELEKFNRKYDQEYTMRHKFAYYKGKLFVRTLVNLTDPEQLHKIYAVFGCQDHHDLNVGECPACRYAERETHTVRVEYTPSTVRYSKRKGLSIKPIKLRTQNGSLFDDILDMVKNQISKVLEKITDGFAYRIMDTLENKVKMAMNKVVFAMKNSAAPLASLASLLYDMLTDQRELSLGVLASYAARFFALGVYGKNLIAMLRASFLRDDEIDASFNIDTEEITIGVLEREDTISSRPNLAESLYTMTPDGGVTLKTESGTGPMEVILAFIQTIIPRMDRNTLLNLQLFNAMSMSFKTIKNLALWIIEVLPASLQRAFKTSKANEWINIVNDPDGLYRCFLQLSAYIMGCKVHRNAVETTTLDKWRTVYVALIKFMNDPAYEMTKVQKDTIVTWHKQLNTMEGGTALRDMEPMWVYFYGASKIGKSACIVDLIANMLNATKDEALASMYCYNPSSEFWDAYTKEKLITFIDDLGAVNSPADPHKDFTQMVNLISPAPYMLPMSTVDDPTVGKKGTYFTSDTIITCSNERGYEVPEYTHPQALINRKHEIIKVERISDVAINLTDHRHLTFSLMGQGARTQGIICDQNCAMTHPRDLDYLGDIMCPNLKCTKSVMNFQEVSRYLYLRRMMKLRFSKILAKTDIAQKNYADHHNKFQKNDKIFLDRYYKNQGIDPLTLQPIGLATQAGIDDKVFADFMEGVANEVEEYESTTRMLARSTRMFLTSVGASFALGFISPFMPRHPISQVLQIITLVVSGVASIIGITSGIYGLHKLSQCIKRGEDAVKIAKEIDIEFQTQSFVTSGNTARQHQKAGVVQRRSGFNTQSGDEVQVPAGCVLMHVDSDTSNPAFFQNAFVVNGYQLITTKHSFVRDREAKHFVIKIQYTRHGRNYSAAAVFFHDDMRFHPDMDMVEIDLKKLNCFPFPDWRSHLVGNGESVPEAFKGDMYVYNKNFGITQHRTIFTAESEFVTKDTAVTPPEDYKVTTGYKTNMVSGDGFCGAMIFDAQQRILGMHVATYTSSSGVTARSITFCREDLELKSSAKIPELKTNAGEHVWANEIVSDTVVPFAHLAKEESHFQNSNTSIRPSLLHDKIRKHTTEPAVLDPRDPRMEEPGSPLFKGVQKYLGQPLELDAERLRRAEEIVDFVWNQHNTGIKGGILTEEQALNGDSSIPHVKGVDLSTSCGHGYKPKGKGKSDYIKPVDGIYKVVDPILRERLDTLWKDLDEGVVVQTVVDSLKDERRKFKKIRSGTTRIFNIYTQEMTIVMTRLFGKAVAHFMELSKYKSPFCVGIDPYSTQWHDKIRQLVEVAIQGFDGDGVFYDANFMLRSLCIAVMKPVIRWITKDMIDSEYWYNKMMNAMLSCRTVIHLLAMFAFFTGRGTLSGEFLTTMLNSLVMLAHTYNAYCDSAPPEHRNVQSFMENIAMLIFGDDHLVTVSAIARRFYGFQQQKAYFDMLRMEYTSGAKTDIEERDHWSLKDMTFLKNKIGRLGHQYVAQLDEEVLWEIVNWITKTDDEYAATVCNVQTALRMWYFYGEKHFTEIRNEIKQHLPSAPLFTYRELDDIYGCYGGWTDVYTPYIQKETNAQILTKMQNNNSNIDRQVTLKTQSAVMDMIAPFAKIVDGIIPHELQKDALGMLGSLDRPTFPDTINKTRIQFAPNMNAIKGIDTSIPLRIDPSSMTLTDENHFRRKSENELRNLWSIPTAITSTVPGDPTAQTFEWNNTQTVGTTLFLELVGPNSEMLGAYSNFSTGPGAVPTLMGFTTRPFVNWTGDIEYEIEVFTSNGFHQGSIRVGFYPGVYDQSEIPSAVDKSSQYYNILNISEGSSKIRLNVPYISQYPWLEICNDSRSDEQNQRFRTTGLFVLSIAKQLRATGQASPSVNIVVRRCAGKNFACANMTMHNNSIQLGSSPWETVAFKTQSGQAGEMSGESMNVATALGTIGTSTAVLDVDHVTTNTTAPTNINPEHPRTQQALGEKAWDIRETGNKQTLFATVDWMDTQANCTVLGKWQLPNDALTCQLNSIARNRFVNVVADMTIQVEVSSSKFQSGALALVYFPCVDKDNFTVGSVNTGFVGTLTQIDFAQHVLMHAGRNTSYKMNVQMRHPQAALYLGKGNSMGVLLLVVYSKLATIAGVPAINVMLHATLDNAHVTTPRPCGAGPIDYTRPGRSLNNMSQIAEIRALEDRVANEGLSRFKTQSGLGSPSTMDTVSVPQSVTAMNPDTPSSESAAVTLGKLPSQRVMTNLHTRSVFHAAHFEDLATQIDLMCKKYAPSATFVTTVDGGTAEDLIIDIGNDLLFADGDGITRAYNGSGLLGWYAALFRGFRGDIRIKLNIRVLPSNTAQPIPEIYGYLNVDYSKLGRTGQNVGGELFHVNAMLTAPVGPELLTPGNPHMHNFIISPAIPEWIEIEVPFVHLGQFQLPPSYSGAINQEPYNFGFLNLRYVNSGASEVILQTRAFCAFGDAAHFGIPTFIPRVRIVPGNYPDFWGSIAPLTEDSSIEVLSESDEDYEQIIVKKKSTTRRVVKP